MARAELMDYDKAIELFEPVLGFEVHVELNTATKMFSDAPNFFGGEPNTNVTPVCLGLPGSLPVVNEQAVKYSISLGLALGCSIAPSSRFARKNYFYPDLAKNYQISQYDEPIAFDGEVEVELADGRLFQIPIERAHMEEDAGKLTHVGGATGRIQGAEYSLVDYNRAGVPLVEIVTKIIYGAEADAPELAKAYVSTIRDMVVALGISEAKMERGNLRCDANISLSAARVRHPRHPHRDQERELAAQRRARHPATRSSGRRRSSRPAARSPRRRGTGTKTPGRPRPAGRRAMPTTTGISRNPICCPCNPPLNSSRNCVRRCRRSRTCAGAGSKQAWGFSDLEFQDVVNSGLLVELEETVAAGAAPAKARKWWTGEIARIANARGVDASSLVSPQHVAELIVLVEAGTLTDRLARQVLEGVIAGEGTPSEVVDSRGLKVVSDDGPLIAAIDTALAAQPDVLAKIRDGKVQAAGAVIGAVMKAMHGQADAARVRELVLERAGQ